MRAVPTLLDAAKNLSQSHCIVFILNSLYQKLFDRKIAVYDELLSLTITFEKLTHPKFPNWNEMTTESKIGHWFLMSGLYTELSTTYLAIDKSISKNITVISPDLSEKFLIWLVHYRTEFDLYNKENLDKTLNIMGEAFLSQATNNNGQIKNLLAESEKNSYKEKTGLQNIQGNLLLKNIDQLNEVLEQIKIDSLQLNKKINHTYL
ncbi:hypothetical protein ACQKCW_12910 [Psychrobacter pacificensis]|uniref:hypothetical protein n=1 Tax=Psychrobacter pacificensis TaxID=112002 RepID=UPI003D03D001